MIPVRGFVRTVGEKEKIFYQRVSSLFENYWEDPDFAVIALADRMPELPVKCSEPGLYLMSDGSLVIIEQTNDDVAAYNSRFIHGELAVGKSLA